MRDLIHSLRGGGREISSEGLDTSFELVLITRSEKETGSKIRR